MTVGRMLWLLPRRVLIWLLQQYQRFISPLYGDVCKFYPTCSHYAVDALREYGVIRGSAMTLWRLLRCNPWSMGGMDPVPHRRERGTVLGEFDVHNHRRVAE